MLPRIEDMDTVIGIDRRGVAHVLKHRSAPSGSCTAEVKLSTTYSETFTTEPKDTGLVQTPTTVRGTAKRVAVDQAAIQSLLRSAIEEGEWVEITGEKVDGDTYSRRLVRPISLTARPGSLSRYSLYCEDGRTRETRTFHIEGIQRAEIVEVG